MSSHIALPSWDPEAGDPVFPRPASLSRPLMVDLLRGELGSEGLVTVDAINMGGMSMHLPYFEMVLECIRAGNDMLLFVRRLGEVIDFLERAVREKRLDEARVEDAARRVLVAKARIGLHRRPRVTTDEECAQALKDTPYRVDAKAMAERSLTLARDRRNLVPLRLPAQARVLSVLVTNHANFKLEAFDKTLAEAGCRVESIRAPMDVGALYDRVESGAFDAIVVSLYYPPSFAWNTERCHGPESRGLMNGWMIANPKVPCVYISFSNPHHVYEFPYMDQIGRASCRERVS
jgi:beta-N-acetylhexosaminidase